MYAGIEFQSGTPEAEQALEFLENLSKKKMVPKSEIGVKPISDMGSRRIVKFAFGYAQAKGGKKVTAVHKVNIMKFTDGLFLEVAKDYPDIEFNERIVDNICMQLMQKPELYNVLVLPNLYGDTVSDLCADMISGLGVAPGGNFGTDIAVFEAIHGSAPKYAGQNKVSPTALIFFSVVMMLRHLNKNEAADRLQQAVEDVINEGTYVTYELAKAGVTPVGTQEMAEAITQKLY